jgi:hypothetical protein
MVNERRTGLEDSSRPVGGVASGYVMAGYLAGEAASGYVMAGFLAGEAASGYVGVVDHNLLPRTSGCIHEIVADSSLSASTEVDRMVVRSLHKPGEEHHPQTNAVGLLQNVSRSS